jgi:cytochrome P450
MIKSLLPSSDQPLNPRQDALTLLGRETADAAITLTNKQLIRMLYEVIEGGGFDADREAFAYAIIELLQSENS